MTKEGGVHVDECLLSLEVNNVVEDNFVKMEENMLISWSDTLATAETLSDSIVQTAPQISATALPAHISGGMIEKRSLPPV